PSHARVLTTALPPDLDEAIYDDPRGNESRIRTDRYGYVTRWVDPLGQATTYDRYDSALLRDLTAPDPDGAGPKVAPKTHFEYDSRFRMTAMVLPDNSQRRWGYLSDWDSPAWSQDQEGRYTNYTIDPNDGDVLRMDAPEGRSTRYTY